MSASPSGKRAGVDPRLALSFAVIAAEGSFTRAAKRLGVTQPWISEQVRKLEEQLRAPLVIRGSRRLELTEEGAAFLEVAQGLLRADGEVQRYADLLRAGFVERLRIGTPVYTAVIRERIELVERFNALHRRINLEIIHAPAGDLIAPLHRGEIDIAMGIAPDELDELELVRLYRGQAFVLVPQEWELARREGLRLADLQGIGVATFPRYADPRLYERFYAPLASSGAVLVPAPESQQQAIERFARLRRLAALRFARRPIVRRPAGDMVALPIADSPIPLDIHVMRLRSRRTPSIDAFWRLAEQAAWRGRSLDEAETPPAASGRRRKA